MVSVAKRLRRQVVALEIVGSTPIAHPIKLDVQRAPVAQWIEHLASDQGVGGSSPFRGTTFSR